MIVPLVGLGAAGEIGSRSETSAAGLDFQFALVDLGRDRLAARDHPRDHDRDDRVPARHDHADAPGDAAAASACSRAKAIAGVLIALFFALLALVVVVAVALPWLAIDGGDIQLVDGDVAERAGADVLAWSSGC